MMRNLVLLAVLIAAAAAYTFYSDRTDLSPINAQSPSATLSAQGKAPAFAFQTPDGTAHNLQDYEGKVVVINFWASWCAPCIIEFPQMIALARRTTEESIFLFLSVDEDAADIEHFLKKHGGDLPANVVIGHDREKAIAQGLFQTYKLPETFILTPGHDIAEKIIGADVSWDSPAMAEKIRRLYGARSM